MEYTNLLETIIESKIRELEEEMYGKLKEVYGRKYIAKINTIRGYTVRFDFLLWKKVLNDRRTANVEVLDAWESTSRKGGYKLILSVDEDEFAFGLDISKKGEVKYGSYRYPNLPYSYNPINSNRKKLCNYFELMDSSYFEG